jgi:hypothetical protein
MKSIISGRAEPPSLASRTEAGEPPIAPSLPRICPQKSPIKMATFSVLFCFSVYNKGQLSLTHEQLKVGIANQRHPLTSSESSQHNSRTRKE